MSLRLESVIGFAGKVKGSLILNIDDQHTLQALGSTVVIKHLLKDEQHFLHCGSSKTSVSCMEMSRDGTLLATGQKTDKGFPASVWIWDLEQRTVIHRLDLYKTNIEDISFSANNQYIATLGGKDDNKLVIWNLRTGDAICGSPAANDTAFCVQFCHNNHTIITAGKYNFRIWKFDEQNRKIWPTNCKLGSLKRIFNCLAITPDDETVYAGTQSGDLFKLSVRNSLFQEKGPAKKSFSMGIQAVKLTKDGKYIIIGTGNGTIALLNRKTLKIVRSLKIDGGITSIELNADGDHFFVGSTKSTVHLVSISDFDFELRTSAHFNRINSVCFPKNYSALFVTAGMNDIRVWNTKNCNELLRINVPNLECNCVLVTDDGSAIISGWNDGKVRAFYPESGKLMFIIHDCHGNGGVTAMAITSDNKYLVTGGRDALVRIWSIDKDYQQMVASLREHQNTIAHITINEDDTECVSASNDGSCVVWNLKKCSRINAFFASTQFTAVLYHPDQSQLITSGTDRMISYWDATDLTAIRVIEGSDTGVVNCMAINSDGSYFVSGGDDRLVKLWNYDEGCTQSIGIGHSGAIKQVVIAPDNSTCVSVGDEGAIMIWKISDESQTKANQENQYNNN